MIHVEGQVCRNSGHLYGLSGVAPDDLSGLAAAHETAGADLARSLIGQYSAAVIDDGTALLAQSSLGLGRAFWHLSPDRLVIGSDLVAVARASGTAALDPVYFARYLTMRPALDRTPFAAVRQLHGGATAVFQKNGVTFNQPWRPQDQPADAAPLDRLEALMEEAISALVPAGTPAAAEISGGTDSSLVAAAATRMGRELHGISHVANRGMRGDDRSHAAEVAMRLGIPLTEFDSDTRGLTTSLDDLPDQPGGCRYRETAFAVRDHVRRSGARRYLTGVGGDVVFDYRGLVPAFLADPLVALRPRAAWRMASSYAAERGGHRGAAHYLRYVGIPVAAAHLRRRNLGEPLDRMRPAWIRAEFAAQAGAGSAPRALWARRPSERYLWETLFDLAAGENIAPTLDATTEVVHPLLHRPLVEFLLGLPPDVRRGIGCDRALQRALLTRLGLPEIAARQDKGSAQQLREMHLAEASAFLGTLEQGELASRGWVDRPAWARAIDQAAVGASPQAAFFGAAVECELWLRRAAAEGW